MKTFIIMLSEPILVSDEEIKEGDWCYYKHPLHEEGMITQIMNLNYSTEPAYRVQHTEGYGVIEGYKKIIAGIEGLPTIDWNGLEEQLGIVDVEKLALEEYHVDTMQRLTTEGFYGAEKSVKGFINGFKASQQLNDKKFSESDMRKAIEIGKEIQQGLHGDKLISELISSLKQPKLIEVEVEMEEYDFDEEWSEESGAYETSKLRPKIVNDKIKLTNKP